MKKLLAILFVFALLVGGASATFAGNGHGAGDCTGPIGDGPHAGSGNGGHGGGGNPDCPDADGDGTCNGQDPDYTPGDMCPNPDCPDDDGDGICNGQDPDWSGNTAAGRAMTSFWNAFGLFGILG